MKITVIAGMILVAVAGGSFMNKHVAGRGEFWSLFLFVTLAMSVAVSANNLLLIFLGD
jgi:NADH:ubiquinone oxidoreductase subunit 2 (subunit N)